MKQQVTFRSGDSKLTAVVDHPRLLTPGSSLSLKDSDDPGVRWVVEEAFELPFKIQRGWDNNI